MDRMKRVIGLILLSVIVSACGGGGSGGGGAGTVSGGGGAASFTVTTATIGSGSIAPASASVSQGGTLSFTLSPGIGETISNVSGCGGSLNGSVYTTGPVSGSCTVTATFSISSYTVTASAGSGGSIGPVSVSVSHDGTASFTVTPSSGFQINSVSGCGGSLSGSTYTTGPITSACSVTASFQQTVTPAPPATFTVSTSTTGTGSGTISPTSEIVNDGQTANFIVTATEGSEIESVTGCGGGLSGATYTTGPVTADCTVSAAFQSVVIVEPPPTSFVITTTVTGSGTGTISPEQATVVAGGTASFELESDDGSTLDGVTGCGGSLNGRTFTTGTISANCNVTVTFSESAPPVANASSITVLAGQLYRGRLDGTSQSGAALSFQITSQPSQGTVTVDPETGDFEYLSATLYEGPDSIQFVVSDGVRQSSAATVSVTVRAWVGTLRIGTQGNEWTNGGIAALDNGDFVVAYTSDQPQDGSPIIGGSDIALARFARNGIPYDAVQIPLADRQRVAGAIASQDGHIVLAYGTTLDVQGKQTEQTGTGVNPDSSILINNGVTIAVPFELSSSTYVSEIEIAGLHLNWGAEYLSDFLFLEIAPDIDGRPSAESDVVTILPVNYQLVGDQVLPPERIVGNVQHQLDAGRYWFLLSYTGEQDGFLLRTETGSENSILGCVAEWTECRDENAVLIPLNRRVGSVVWGIAGTPALSRVGILKVTLDGGVLWSWTAPESIVDLPRLAVDTTGNIHALGWDREGPRGGGGPSWLFSFDESGAQIAARQLEYLGLESGECRVWETGRSLAVDPVGRVLVGGLLAIDLECHQDYSSYRQGAFLYALNPNGTLAWSIEDKATDPPHLDFISYIRATNAGTTAVSFLRSGANVGYRSLQVDPLGTLVNTREGALSMAVDDGAHDDTGHMLLVSQSFGEGILIARLDGLQNLEWEQQIRTTLPNGSLGEDTGRGAIFLEDGSVLVVGTVTGSLPGSHLRGGTDIVVIRVLPDGTVDH